MLYAPLSNLYMHALMHDSFVQLALSLGLSVTPSHLINAIFDVLFMSMPKCHLSLSSPPFPGPANSAIPYCYRVMSCCNELMAAMCQYHLEPRAIAVSFYGWLMTV